MRSNIIFIMVVFLGILVFYGVRYTEAPVPTTNAYITKCEESIRGEAFIIKKESVNKAKTDGLVYTSVNDGERVGKERKIATIYNSGVNSNTLKEIRNIDKKIQVLKDGSKNIIKSSEDSEENLVMSYIDDIENAVYNDDMSKVASIKDDIKSVKENRGTGSNDEMDNVNTLTERKNMLEAQIGSKKEDIYSLTAGVFVAGTDGFEDVLTPDMMETMTISDFDNLKREINETRLSEVKKGDNVCKVIDNNKWYIVIKTEAEKLSDSKVGDKVSLKFDVMPGSEAPAEIHYISKEENGQVLLFIKCESYIKGIFSVRYSDVDVVLKHYTGIRLPIYAIRVRDNQPGVMINENYKEVFKPCKIVYTDKEEGYVIIRSSDDSSGNNDIEINDIIIVGEK